MVLGPDDHSAVTNTPNLQDCDFATKNLKNFLSNAGIFYSPRTGSVKPSLGNSFQINDSRTKSNNTNLKSNSNLNNINQHLDVMNVNTSNLHIKYNDKINNSSHVYAGPICRDMPISDESLMPFVNGKYISNGDSDILSNGLTLTNNRNNGTRGRKYVGNKFTSQNQPSPDNHYALPVYMRAPAPKSVPIPKNLFKN